jgi:hypothetical protein
MDIETKGGLTLVMFKYGHEYDGSCLDEQQDKDLFHPDGITIAYVLSNFCNEYHPSYFNLSKQYIETNKQRFKEHNNNRGRKKKNKPKKNRKKNNGTNDEFGSCITFGVISGSRVHGVKMFRKDSGNISKLTYADIESPTYIPELLGKLFNYINSIKPVGIKFISFNLSLANITGGFPLPPGKIINLYMLREKLNLGLYAREYWGCHSVIYMFNGKVNHLTTILREHSNIDRTTNLKLTSEGKIHVYGSDDNVKSARFMRLLCDIINTHKNDDYFIIDGIRAIDKPKDRPDFTKPLNLDD